MGNCESLFIQKPYIECTYQIDDVNNKIRIMNNKCGEEINNDLETKIKIANCCKEEKLSFKMKFNETGEKIIYFIIEGKLLNMSYMFRNCSSLKKIRFVSVDTDQVTKMNSMFSGCYQLESVDLSNFNTIQVNDMNSMFYKCFNIKVIKGINNFKTNNVTIMKKLFYSCLELESLDLSNFNTNNVTDMGYMFSKCYKLKEIIGITKFNTSNVTSMKSMFMENVEMTNLDLSKFDTANVNDMSFMFCKCYSLKEIKGINDFKTNKVTKMNSMFQECTILDNLDLSNYNTSNVTNMEFMFDKCVSLKHIKGINNFDLTNVIKSQKLKISQNKNSNPDNNVQKMTIIFISSDQKINCKIECMKTDKFYKIQDKLYLKYPQLKNLDINYLAEGQLISKSASLEENNVKDGTRIIIDI